ncbi:hypothetical protein KC19_12G032000 [Ceratodon purpureus]|uniref:Protein kinase domain-containing protein n=1 Tax=Ceratodon purpureus TaxID=3225 RepID=A0A8T0G310_CERPU|nr:hypothetical protein KC19_12G032000 [Ceratodon purpureus]
MRRKESLASTALDTVVKSTPEDFQPSNSLFPDLENTMTEYFDLTDFQIYEDARTEYFDTEACFTISENTVTQHVEPSAGLRIKITDVIDHVEPAKEQAMIEHFELAQGSRGSLPEAELDCHGRVIELRRCAHPTDSPLVADYSQFDLSKFIRLSSESFPDLEGPQLKLLSDLCLTAHRSEEFFLSVAKNQWVRTSVTSDRPPDVFFSATSADEECSKLISSVTIHSNVLPCDPFWTKLRAMRDWASQRVHFPFSILKEAVLEGNSLMKQLVEWREKREECDIGKHGLKRSLDGKLLQKNLRLLWEIRADVKPVKLIAEGSDGTLWLVTWRGGIFARKDRRMISNNSIDPKIAVDTELNVVEKLFHPNIVYTFGVSNAGNTNSLFMEYMQSDLSHFILDRVRITDGDEPPFSHQDSIDVLLQFAQAMAYMHREDVVHGDLKSLNILISEILISENEKHFLVKVADFGSARSMISSDSGSAGFKPGPATTKYAAPEVLKMREDKDFVISIPKALDVYSFGIVAFEVLTGEELYCDVNSQTKLKRGIIDGTLRPSLRQECQRENFLNDERMISLVESCWHGDPSMRPSFSKIVEALHSIGVKILNPTSRSDHHPRQEKFLGATPGVLEVPTPVKESHRQSRVPLQVHSTCAEARSKSVFSFSSVFQR